MGNATRIFALLPLLAIIAGCLQNCTNGSPSLAETIRVKSARISSNISATPCEVISGSNCVVVDTNGLGLPDFVINEICYEVQNSTSDTVILKQTLMEVLQPHSPAVADTCNSIINKHIPPFDTININAPFCLASKVAFRIGDTISFQLNLQGVIVTTKLPVCQVK